MAIASINTSFSTEDEIRREQLHESLLGLVRFLRDTLFRLRDTR